MTGCYRVHLAQVDSNYQSDNYVLDVEVDTSMIPLKQRTFFGVWGRLNDPEYRYPFLLLQDGQIDFGASYEPGDPQRFHKTNLLSKALTEGEFLSVWGRDPGTSAVEREYTLRVSRMTSLGR
jgi:hypothetical protein